MSEPRRLAAEALFLAAEEVRKKKELDERNVVKDAKWRKAQRTARKEEKRRVKEIVRKAEIAKQQTPP